MLNDGSGFKKVYLATGFTDLRKGIDGFAIGLSVLVKLFGNTLFGNHALYRNSIGVI